jgi:hypothetical protein
MKAGLTPAICQAELDGMAPAAADAKLGTLIVTLITNYNTLVTQYNALLAHIDAGDVAGIGNTNTVNFAGKQTATLGSL